jgi:hypothetical protein
MYEWWTAYCKKRIKHGTTLYDAKGGLPDSKRFEEMAQLLEISPHSSHVCIMDGNTIVTIVEAEIRRANSWTDLHVMVR